MTHDYVASSELSSCRLRDKNRDPNSLEKVMSDRGSIQINLKTCSYLHIVVSLAAALSIDGNSGE